jgi:hypothetical protein
MAREFEYVVIGCLNGLLAHGAQQAIIFSRVKVLSLLAAYFLASGSAKKSLIYSRFKPPIKRS